MGLGDKIFELARRSIVLGDKVDSLAAQVSRIDDHIHDIDKRLVRFETFIEVAAGRTKASMIQDQS